MNRIMRNSGAALAAIFIAGSLTACGPGSASSSRSDTNPTEVSTDLGNKKGSVRPRLTRKACSPKTRLFDCAERSNKRVEISLLQRQIDDSVQMCKQAFF